MAATEQVYNTTTVEQNKATKWFVVPTEYLDVVRFGIKVVTVLLSLVAFVLEEVVYNCMSCSPLYFFEFISCTAFLFTGLLVVLMATPLHRRVGISCWPMLDFVYTAVIGIFFLIASIVFAADNGGTAREQAAVAFGFLASIMFVVDLGVFVKTKGLPCRPKAQTPPANQNQIPESEKLNANGAD